MVKYGPGRRVCSGRLAGAVTVAAVLAALLSGAGAAAGTRAAAGVGGAVLEGGWGAAQRVAGLAALDRGLDMGITAFSCGSAGSCAEGGSYADAAGHGQAFVVSEANGVWGRAEEVPGTAALNRGGEASVWAVSCAVSRYCVAGGSYTDAAGHGQAFVVSEANGVWGRAEKVPGTAALNRGGVAGLDAVSCAPGGYCAAGGSYADAAGHGQVFVVSERHGTWGTAREVRGIAPLNPSGQGDMDTLSCPSPGNCGAAGIYGDAAGGLGAFVVSQVHGTWRKAEMVPGSATLNHGWTVPSEVSCPSAGNCGAGGIYQNADGNFEAYVGSEVNGTWGKAREVPGTAALNRSGYASVYSVSCRAPGTCSAGGYYNGDSRHQQAFVVSQVNGVWGTAQQVPGTAALNKGGQAQVNQVSCGAPGDCSAGGFYTGASKQERAFLVDQAHGVWGTGQQVPGIAWLTKGGSAEIDGLSCPARGQCAAVGWFTPAGSKSAQLFVVTQTPPA